MERITKATKRFYLNIIEIIIALVILISAYLISNITIFSTVMLQSIIQAEATVLGFLGIIIAYTLASCDSRLDRLEQQRFDLDRASEILIVKGEEKKHFEALITRLKQRKKDIANAAGLNSFLLILALILSIIILGLQNSDLSVLKFLDLLNLFLLFIGVFGIITVFIQISEE